MSLSTSNTYLSAKIRAWWQVLQRPSLWIILALTFSILMQLNGTPEWKSPLWFEALQYGVPDTLFSPCFFMTPLVLAYYVVVYAQFLALPLLVVGETLLWHGDTPRLPWWRKVLYGLVLGITCWFIAGLWGELTARLFAGFKGF